MYLYPGGKLDIADRLFFSIEHTFDLVYNGSDNKELTPEFFQLCEGIEKEDEEGGEEARNDQYEVEGVFQDKKIKGTMSGSPVKACSKIVCGSGGKGSRNNSDVREVRGKQKPFNFLSNTKTLGMAQDGR